MSDLRNIGKSLLLDHEKFRLVSTSLVAAMADTLSLSPLKKRQSFSLSMGYNISILERTQNVFQVKQIHAPLTTSGMLHNLLAVNKLLYGYARHKDLAYACLVFDRMFERTTVSWNIMVGGFAKIGDYMQCLGTFRELIRSGGQPNDSTFPVAIKACRDFRGIDMGRLIHCFVVKYGSLVDQFVCAALVDMYAKSGVIQDAQQLFNEMASKDLVTWTVMICAYAGCGNANESLVMFDRLQEEGFVPDNITMVAVVNACAKLGALSKARLVHDYITGNKFSLDVILGTALVDMYAKCRSPDSARDIFDKIQEKDVITWNAMIAAYGYLGEGKKALELFSMMLSSGIYPNKITFVLLLYACSHSGLVEEGLWLFSLMSASYGLRAGIEHYTCMVDLLGRAGRLDEALRLIENMTVEKDEGLWSALLQASKNHKCMDIAEKAAKALIELQSRNPEHYIFLSNIYADTGRWKESAEIRDLITERKLKKNPYYTWIEVGNITGQYRAEDISNSPAKENNEMLKILSNDPELSGYVPNHTFRELNAITDSICRSQIHQETLISFLLKSKNIFQVKQIHAQVTTGFMLPILTATNRLLIAYTRHKDLSDACFLFDRMEERNLVSWNIMIGGCAKVGDYMQCLRTFRELITCGLTPDNYTLCLLIPACRDSLGINIGRSIHCCVVKYGFNSYEYVCAALLDMYAKGWLIEEAKCLFNDIPSKDLAIWRVMFNLYVKAGKPENLLALFDQLRKEGPVPDKATVEAVVNACAKLGCINKAKPVHDFISEGRYPLDAELGTAMINMLAKCRRVNSAREIFDEMENRDVFTWNTMIEAYGYNRKGKEALELFYMMPSNGIVPDKMTFLSLLDACNRAGMVEEGTQLFSSMLSYDVMPDMKHYTLMASFSG